MEMMSDVKMAERSGRVGWGGVGNGKLWPARRQQL